MDTVTYPDQVVQRELESWQLERLDASRHPQAARELGVRAVPVAVAVIDGRPAGRLENFVAADVFSAWLAELLETVEP